MKTKTLFSLLLLGFVAVSVAMALRKIGSEPSSGSLQTASSDESGAPAGTVGLAAKLAESRFSAVYFHSPHRCPTCRKIESFALEALTPEIEDGMIAWRTADYTSDSNASLVDQFKVFTSTVVLVEAKDDKVVRWKNLEEVWDHTGDPKGFTDFVNQAWAEFKKS